MRVGVQSFDDSIDTPSHCTGGFEHRFGLAFQSSKIAFPVQSEIERRVKDADRIKWQLRSTRRFISLVRIGAVGTQIMARGAGLCAVLGQAWVFEKKLTQNRPLGVESYM